MEWISVKDRLPEEGGRYWCYIEEVLCLGQSSYQWNCAYNELHGFTVEPLHGTVTHWQPLPPPPEA